MTAVALPHPSTPRTAALRPALAHRLFDRLCDLTEPEFDHQVPGFRVRYQDIFTAVRSYQPVLTAHGMGKDAALLAGVTVACHRANYPIDGPLPAVLVIAAAANDLLD